jgi:glycosyltransferase involved in cell wall biosynthesis
MFVIAKAPPTRAGGPRVDYRWLAAQLGASVIDDADRPTGLARLERLLRLDLGLAWRARGQTRDAGAAPIVCFSESIGLALTPMLPASASLVVFGYHLRSRLKAALLRESGVAGRWRLTLVHTQVDADRVPAAVGLPPGRVIHVPYRVDTHFFRPGPLGQRGEAADVICLGLAHRDYPTLFAALAALPRVRAIVIDTRHGPDPSLARPLNVRVCRPADDATLRRLYCGSRLAVVPLQTTTQSGSGVQAVLQGLACGLPVLATATDAMREYLNDGQAGRLVATATAPAWADAITAVLADAELQAALSLNGRRRAESEYSLERWCERMKEVMRLCAP